jgi:hypothetical protein
LRSLLFATDMWTSEGHKSYITLTCHHMTSELCVTNHELGCSHFPYVHTAYVVHETGIACHVHSSVCSDRCLKAALHRTSWIHIQCVADTCQFAITDENE